MPSLVWAILVVFTILDQASFMALPNDCDESWTQTRCLIESPYSQQWSTYCYNGTNGQIEACRDWPDCEVHCGEYKNSCDSSRKIALDKATQTNVKYDLENRGKNTETDTQFKLPVLPQLRYASCDWTFTECQQPKNDTEGWTVNCYEGATGPDTCRQKCPDIKSPSWGCQGYCPKYLLACSVRDVILTPTNNPITNKAEPKPTEKTTVDTPQNKSEEKREPLPAIITKTPGEPDDIYVEKKLESPHVQRFWRTIACIAIGIIALLCIVTVVLVVKNCLHVSQPIDVPEHHATVLKALLKKDMNDADETTNQAASSYTIDTLDTQV